RLDIPLAWEPSKSERVAAIEVYPAATLIAHGIPIKGYKKKDNIAARQATIARLERLLLLPEDRARMEQSADALDAVVCVLAGHDFLREACFQPRDTELARHEGWIWVRTKALQSCREH